MVHKKTEDPGTGELFPGEGVGDAPAQKSFFAERIEEIKAKDLELRKGEIQDSETDATMPWWGDEYRGVPADLARSALFSVRGRHEQRKVFAELTTLRTWGDRSLLFQGEQLDQFDREVWMEVMNRFKSTLIAGRVGGQVFFTKRDILNSMGWNTNGSSMKRLDECLKRLYDAQIQIIVPMRYTYNGRLLADVLYGEEVERYRVTILSDAVRLFGPDHVRLHHQTYMELVGDVSKWMHIFCTSHYGTEESPQFLSTTDMLDLMSRPARPDHTEFARTVRAAAEQLCRQGVLHGWKLTRRARRGVSYYVLAYWHPPRKKQG